MQYFERIFVVIVIVIVIVIVMSCTVIIHQYTDTYVHYIRHVVDFGPF